MGQREADRRTQCLQLAQAGHPFLLKVAQDGIDVRESALAHQAARPEAIILT
jgi:hypothetical protein